MVVRGVTTSPGHTGGTRFGGPSAGVIELDLEPADGYHIVLHITMMDGLHEVRNYEDG
jgi:hypothetical protein